MSTISELLKTDLLLLLLYSKGRSGSQNEPIKGITRLMKLLFILKEENGVEIKFNFEPYKMGPFSSEVYPELEFLQNFPSPDKPLLCAQKANVHLKNELITPEQFKVINDISVEEQPLSSSEINTEFYLSDLGKKVAEQLWRNLDTHEKETIERIKFSYGSMSLKELLRYVYKTYPEMTINSEIKDHVL